MPRTSTIATRLMPAQPSFLFHVMTAPDGSTSKCLSESDIELCRLHSSYRIQISSDVETNGTDRSGISESNADRVCVISDEMTNADRAVNIPAVIENCCTQSVFDAEGETEF